MKKILFSLFAMAGMLFATSCSQEEDFAPVVADGSEVELSFSVQLPQEIATRSYSDGTTATVLSYAIYDAADEKQAIVIDGTATFSGLKATVTETLATGKTYNMIFWAQSPDNTTYNADLATQTLTVDYTAMKANDENNDAFYAFENFKVEGAINKEVKLYRPFAQINLGTDDFAKAAEAGLTVGETRMVAAELPSQMSLVDGTTSNPVTVKVLANALPQGETFPVAGYEYLEMNYVLVGKDKATIDCEFIITEEGAQDLTPTIVVSNVPVQRNYRTNIYGSLLTDPASFTIEIDSEYEDSKHLMVVETVEELLSAASKGVGAILAESLVMQGDKPYLQVSEDWIFNIPENVDFTTGNTSNYGIIVTGGTTEIDGNGNIKSQGGGIGVANGANVIFNGGNLDVNSLSTSGRYLFYLEGEGSTVTINGGNFDFNKTQNQKRAYIYASEGTTVYVKGGTFGKASTRSGYTAGILGSGTVVITGGTFGFDPTAWVAEGYKAETNGTQWTVSAE